MYRRYPNDSGGLLSRCAVSPMLDFPPHWAKGCVPGRGPPLFEAMDMEDGIEGLLRQLETRWRWVEGLADYEELERFVRDAYMLGRQDVIRMMEDDIPLGDK